MAQSGHGECPFWANVDKALSSITGGYQHRVAVSRRDRHHRRCCCFDLDYLLRARGELTVKSIADLNKYNERFWRAQRWLAGKRLGVAEIAAAADALMRDEAMRGVPMKYRRSYEMALRDAAVAIRAAMSAMKRRAASRAGSAKKGDALTVLIRELVAKRPRITVTELKKELLAHQHFKGVIDVSENEILIEVKTGKRTRTIPFPLSGLKDRLSRVKKEIRLAKSR